MVFPQGVPNAHDSSSIRSHLEEITQDADSIFGANGFWVKLNAEHEVLLMAKPHDVTRGFQMACFEKVRATYGC